MSRRESSNFRSQIYIPKAMVDSRPNGFIWTLFFSDLDQAIFEARYTIPKLWQICVRMASFGHFSIQIWIKPFPEPNARSQTYCRFASRWLHLDICLSRSGSSHFRSQIHPPKAIADLLPDGFISTLFCPDVDQAVS